MKKTFIVIFAGVLFSFSTAHAEKNSGRILGSKFILYSDFIGTVNPDGVVIYFGGRYRNTYKENRQYNVGSAYLEGGINAGITPAYGQIGVNLEWMPVLFLKLNTRYDLFSFFGDFGSLLSFDSPDARFGPQQIDGLSGKEETASAQRFMLRPTLQAKVGRFYISNQTDLSYYRFNGDGPYFFEQENDVLLMDKDELLSNKTYILYEVRKGRGESVLMGGPFYEFTRANDANIIRRRLGGVIFWIPEKPVSSIKEPHIFTQISVNLRDRNRKDEVFFVAGFGFEFELK